MTAFALLTFLDHGETAQSEEFGVHILNAIQFLINVAVQNKGKLASDFRDDHWPYEHAIATQAMFHKGGSEWSRYQKLVFPRILEKQAANGSFIDVNQPEKEPIKTLGALFKGTDPGHIHYRTCLATLILQAHYRNSQLTKKSP